MREIHRCGGTSESPGAWHRCWITTDEKLSCSIAWFLHFLEVRSFTMATKLAWETMSTLEIAMVFGPRCNGLPTGMEDSRRLIHRGCTCRPSPILSMAST